MKVGECREVFDYVISPEWEPIGEELARNTVKYRRLLESNTLDPLQGSHILLVNGELVEYGNEISPEDDEELGKKYPGCLYAPVIERFAVIRKFSASNDQTRKEWQVCTICNLIDDDKVIVKYNLKLYDDICQ